MIALSEKPSDKYCKKPEALIALNNCIEVGIKVKMDPKNNAKNADPFLNASFRSSLWIFAKTVVKSSWRGSFIKKVIFFTLMLIIRALLPFGCVLWPMKRFFN